MVCFNWMGICCILTLCWNRNTLWQGRQWPPTRYPSSSILCTIHWWCPSQQERLVTVQQSSRVRDGQLNLPPQPDAYRSDQRSPGHLGLHSPRWHWPSVCESQWPLWQNRWNCRWGGPLAMFHGFVFRHSPSWHTTLDACQLWRLVPWPACPHAESTQKHWLQRWSWLCAKASLRQQQRACMVGFYVWQLGMGAGGKVIKCSYRILNSSFCIGWDHKGPRDSWCHVRSNHPWKRQDNGLGCNRPNRLLPAVYIDQRRSQQCAPCTSRRHKPCQLPLDCQE